MGNFSKPGGAKLEFSWALGQGLFSGGRLSGLSSEISPLVTGVMFDSTRRDEKVRSIFLIQERSLRSFVKVYFWHDIYFVIKKQMYEKLTTVSLIKTS